MINLANARRHFRDRVAEVGPEFWSPLDDVMYINLAQNYIAAVTRGVTAEVSGQVGRGSGFLPLPARLLNAHQQGGYDVDNGKSLGVISVADSNVVTPNWRSEEGVRPKWFVLDVDARRAYVTPIPYRPAEVSLRVSVLPDEVENDPDLLFNGVPTMDKYLNVLTNVASMYAFLKERYEGDAEKIYAFINRELMELGINPNDIPPFRQVAADAEG